MTSKTSSIYEPNNNCIYYVICKVIRLFHPIFSYDQRSKDIKDLLHNLKCILKGIIHTMWKNLIFSVIFWKYAIFV